MPSSKSAHSSEPHSVIPFGCQNCRDQHLKCDRATPACGRCLASGKACTRGYKFRVKSGPFTRKQRWVKPPRKLEFVEYAFMGEDEDADEDASSWSAEGPALAVIHSTALEEAIQSAPPRQELLLELPVPNGAGHPPPRSPTDRFIVHDDFIVAATPLRLDGSDEPVGPGIYREESAYPLQDKQEAMLLRHYVEKLAVWLDINEPGRPFGNTVPLRAGTCSVLLNAILALSAKHLAHVSDFDRYASDRYHHKCLNKLIPLLSNEATAADENLFAATIILRMWEEMEVTHTGRDSHSYLLGIHAFVHGHGNNLLPNTLSAASFWAGLRQEIYSATVNQKPVKAPLAPSLVEGVRGFGPVEDHDWSNRAVIHCVDVLNFCFGETPPRQTWDELYEWNQRWTELLPSSYTPILYIERQEGKAFPEIWYHSSWHITGVQHHTLAELFLVSFDPKVPRVGGQRREATKRMDERIRTLVRKICGIGLSNQGTPPGMFVACMAIGAFGDRFHDRSDQEAFLDILCRTEKDHSRPTEAVQQQMMESWDWNSGH